MISHSSSLNRNRRTSRLYDPPEIQPVPPAFSESAVKMTVPRPKLPKAGAAPGQFFQLSISLAKGSKRNRAVTIR
jgi:hypothetical protein